MSIKLGSLFDGIGGFPYSGIKFGITPAWASEIEPWPIKVTEHHFPNMKHLGDITQINGGEIEPVDIITFGSPCQDLSVAGKREGLAGERSGLFMDAIRIIRQMRDATGGEYPRFAVWENVPGAFSSNKGEDFRAVLEEITEAEIPMPRSGKWATAGMVRTGSCDIAWRCIDAQHWGVPQRRRRIFLVADFRGQCAGEILFVEEGLSGHFAESGETWEEAAAAVGDGTESTIYGFIGKNSAKTRGIGIGENLSPTIDTTNNVQIAICPSIGFDNQTGQSEGIVVSPAIRSESRGSLPCVATRGIIPFDTTQITSPTNGNNPKPGDPCHTLQATAHVPKVAIPLDTSRINSTPEGISGAVSSKWAKGTGGPAGDECYNLVIEPRSQDGVCRVHNDGVVPTLNTAQGGQRQPCVMAFTQNQREEIRDLQDKAGALATEPGMHQQTFVLQGSMIGRADKNGPQGDGINEEVSFTLNTIDRHAVASGYAVRRLTPLECLRLMGFPDYWLDIEGMSDTQKYRSIGNSVAIPCVKFVLGGIARVLGGEKE